MLFERIGIHGWQEIESVVLAAAVSDLSILLVGDIGSNKTEGARAIAEAVLGPEIEFRNYEVPTLSFDDLIGFINPRLSARVTLSSSQPPFPSGRLTQHSSTRSIGRILSSSQSFMNSFVAVVSWECPQT